MFFRKCLLNNDPVIQSPGKTSWKQELLSQISSGIVSILDQLSEKVQQQQNNKMKASSPYKSTPKTPELTKQIENKSSDPIELAKRQLDFTEDQKENSEANLVTKKPLKNCSVVIKDVRKHPWWGPKVRQLSGSLNNIVIRPRILKKNFLDLPKLRSRAETYNSVLEFHLDLKRLISEAPMPSDSEAILGVLESYKELAGTTFPWFNAQKPLTHYEPIRDEVVRPPNRDHFYAKSFLPCEEQSPKFPRKKNVETLGLDMRSCLLCSQYGDRRDEEGGRLLHYR